MIFKYDRRKINLGSTAAMLLFSEVLAEHVRIARHLAKSSANYVYRLHTNNANFSTAL